MSYLAFRDEAVGAVAESDWLSFGDLGDPDWQPGTKLELVQAWNTILPTGYAPPLMDW